MRKRISVSECTLNLRSNENENCQELTRRHKNHILRRSRRLKCALLQATAKRLGTRAMLTAISDVLIVNTVTHLLFFPLSMLLSI